MFPDVAGAAYQSCAKILVNYRRGNTIRCRQLFVDQTKLRERALLMVLKVSGSKKFCETTV